MFRKKVNKRQLGEFKEALAASYLRGRGLKLLQSNYACRAGEIDLIMLDKPRQLVFVEVRFRSSKNFGSAAETIGPSKQQKLRRAAAHYLQQNPSCHRLPCRFDVVAMHPSSASDSHSLEWIKNAFC